MRHGTSRLTSCPLLLLLAACQMQPADDPDPRPGALVASIDPDSVPTTISLNGQEEQVLVVTLTASADGYTAQGETRTGVPSSTILQDRDVLIEALDAQGGVLYSITVENPRLIRTAGTRDPATAVRPEATVTVAFSRPDQIGSVRVTVRSGPNAELQSSFPVVRGTIGALTPG